MSLCGCEDLVLFANEVYMNMLCPQVSLSTLPNSLEVIGFHPLEQRSQRVYFFFFLNFIYCFLNKLHISYVTKWLQKRECPASHEGSWRISVGSFSQLKEKFRLELWMLKVQGA